MQSTFKEISIGSWPYSWSIDDRSVKFNYQVLSRIGNVGNKIVQIYDLDRFYLTENINDTNMIRLNDYINNKIKEHMIVANKNLIETENRLNEKIKSLESEIDELRMAISYMPPLVGSVNYEDGRYRFIKHNRRKSL